MAIILHKDESLPDPQDSPIIILKHLPLYILVKLMRTQTTKLDGLEDCVVLLEPITTSYVSYQMRTTMSMGKNCTALHSKASWIISLKVKQCYMS